MDDDDDDDDEKKEGVFKHQNEHDATSTTTRLQLRNRGMQNVWSCVAYVQLRRSREVSHRRHCDVPDGHPRLSGGWSDGGSICMWR